MFYGSCRAIDRLLLIPPDIIIRAVVCACVVGITRTRQLFPDWRCCYSAIHARRKFVFCSFSVPFCRLSSFVFVFVFCSRSRSLFLSLSLHPSLPSFLRHRVLPSPLTLSLLSPSLPLSSFPTVALPLYLRHCVPPSLFRSLPLLPSLFPLFARWR